MTNHHVSGRPTAMPGKMGKERNRLRDVLSYLVSIATILGIPIGLYGYYASQHGKRVEKTFEFYRTYRSEATQKHWTLLVGLWNSNAKETKELVVKRDDDGLKSLLVQLVNSDKKIGDALEYMVEFYDEFSACIENSLCDQNTGYALLKEPANQFVGAYGSYLQFVRETYGNRRYGAGAYKVRALAPVWQPF